MNLPSLKPLNKVTASTLFGLITPLVFYLLRRYGILALDAEGVAIITALVAGLSGYLTPLSTAEVEQIVQAPDAPAQMPIGAQATEQRRKP